MPLPKNAHLLRRIDERVGFFTKPVVDRQGVVEAYMLLLVIEERAMKQFARWERAFAAVGDHETSRMIGEIRKDEERHLKYCEAITRRYSEDEAARQARLAYYRALEAECYEEVQALNLRALVANGFVGKTWWTKALWRTLADVAGKRLPQDLREVSVGRMEGSRAAA
jgi:hypothetical protein